MPVVVELDARRRVGELRRARGPRTCAGGSTRWSSTEMSVKWRGRRSGSGRNVTCLGLGGDEEARAAAPGRRSRCCRRSQNRHGVDRAAGATRDAQRAQREQERPSTGLRGTPMQAVRGAGCRRGAGRSPTMPIWCTGNGHPGWTGPACDRRCRRCRAPTTPRSCEPGQAARDAGRPARADRIEPTAGRGARRGVATGRDEQEVAGPDGHARGRLGRFQVGGGDRVVGRRGTRRRARRARRAARPGRRARRRAS